MKKINKKGFTLTELIVVIAVIAILAAVLIPTLTGYIEKARVSADNQEVAVLNKLLLDAEINEVEFKDVTELKKYLAEEMDYDGDYTLGVKGSYLFYDKEKYEFVIVKEDEIEGLKMTAGDYKLAAAMSSPEGILVNKNNKEVLLVGGKGDLVEIVNTLRNIGDLDNDDQIDLKKVSASLSSLIIEFATKNVFVGDNENIVESSNGVLVVKTATEANKADKTQTTLSDKVSSLGNLQAAFFNKYIIDIIDRANIELSEIAELSYGEQNINGSYDIKVFLKVLEDNDVNQLVTILQAVTGLMTTLYDINEKYYSDTILELNISPSDIGNEQPHLPADLAELISKIEVVLGMDCSEDTLLDNIDKGIKLTTKDIDSELFEQEKFNALFTILAALFVNKDDFQFNGNLNLGVIANVEGAKKTNVVSISATFGKDLVVTYNFEFIG